MNTSIPSATSHLTTVRIPRSLGPGIIMEIVFWLNGNCKNRYCLPVNQEIVFFHDADDAVAFKLKFGL